MMSPASRVQRKQKTYAPAIVIVQDHDWQLVNVCQPQHPTYKKTMSIYWNLLLQVIFYPNPLTSLIEQETHHISLSGVNKRFQMLQ